MTEHRVTVTFRVGGEDPDAFLAAVQQMTTNHESNYPLARRDKDKTKYFFPSHAHTLRVLGSTHSPLTKGQDHA